MSDYSEELYHEMIQNEESEAPCYFEEDNCYLPVFNEILSNYE